MEQPEYKIADTSVNTIRFYNSHAEDNIEILRLSKDGIWANPDVPTDDAAKLVLAAIDDHIQELVRQAVAAKLDAVAAKVKTDFSAAFGADTCESWAVWIRSQK